MNRYNESTNSLLRTESGKQFFKTTRYPNIPASVYDTYIVASDADFLDTLALKYYNDKSLYWIIAQANGCIGKWSITPGLTLRIPYNKDAILTEFNRINNG